MIFTETKIKGTFIIEPELHRDERGFFGRFFCVEEFEDHGLDSSIVQCNISCNNKKGTLRGLHYQIPPHQEAKIVSCTEGSIYDVVLDLRKESDTYCHWTAIELTDNNLKMLYIPKGCAHGFQTLKNKTRVFYQMTDFFHQESARGVRWNDAIFGIQWPTGRKIISEKDKQFSEYMLMKTVMLTGASGFIGRHCIPLLINQGYEVHALTSKNNSSHDPRISWHRIDLLNPDQVREAMKTISPSHLLHLAWYTAPGKYWSAWENIHWLQAGLNMVQEFSANGGKRMVGAGTCAEYDWRYGYCSENITPLKPLGLYGISKHSLHCITEETLNTANISNAWGRIFFLYGPHENRTRLVPSIVGALLQLKPAPCTSGHQIRDYLFVEDVADAFVQILGITGYRAGKYRIRQTSFHP